MTHRIYQVEWKGFVDYVSASSHSRAKARVMQIARSAGYWHPGESLAGLRCRIAPAGIAPSDCAVLYAQ